MLGWRKHKLEARLLGEIPTISDDITEIAESEEELRSLLMRVKEESEIAGLNLNIKEQQQKNEDHGIEAQHFLSSRCGGSESSD